jgi:HAD superfamily hydrolase (TIGR01509 family)
MMIKAIIWDLGGVITYYKTGGFQLFWKDIEGSHELRNEFGSGKISTKEFIERGSKLLGISKKSFLEDYKKLYFGEVLNEEVFKIYKEVEITRYILSDTNPIVQRFRNKKFKKVYLLTKKNFLSTKLKTRKADIGTFTLLIKNIKLKPEEVIFIDDIEKYVEKAKSLGMKTIHYKNPEQLKREFERFNLI